MGTVFLQLVAEIIPALALAATLVVALRTAERDRLGASRMFQAGVIGLLGALLGGRTLPWMMGVLSGASPSFFEGDFGAMGALAGAFLAGAGFLRLRREPVLRYADSAVAGVGLGYAIIRLACLLEGHCFGIPSDLPWAIRYGIGSPAFDSQLSAGLIDAGAAHSLPVHPTQLYHAAVGLILFFVLSRAHRSRPGTRLALALLGYGAGRFVVEFFRAETSAVLGPLDFTQVLCIAMVAAGIGVAYFSAGVRALTIDRRQVA